MKVQVIGSSAEGEADRQYASSYVIDRELAVDAGPLGFWGTPDDQACIRHIFLTHSHIDHIASLPLFVEHAYDPNQPAVTVHGSAATMEALQKYIFNDVIWPDFVRIRPRQRPFMILNALVPDVEIQVGRFRVTPVEVDHLVPTFGYIITDGRSTSIFGGDSAPTDRIWKVAHQFPAPRMTFLEASFPNSMVDMAVLTKHLCPAQFVDEYAKMPTVEKVVAIHLKKRFRDVLCRELADLPIPGLVIAEGSQTYEI